MKNFGSTSNVEHLKKSIDAFTLEQPNPILFQPENKITNGKGVLKFKDWPFSLANEVQPVYLTIRRPIFDISITTITSSYWSDIFWYLFSPWTVYNLCFMPVQKKGNMNDIDFAESVRQNIATGLKVYKMARKISFLNTWD